jgi:hypothetical protein
MTRRRLGWLGPVIVLVGIVVACLGGWFLVAKRPEPGPVLEKIVIDEQHAFVVRAEVDSDRNFIELHEGDQLVWRAMVPPYAGRPGAPGIAWGQGAITVRVIREGRAEIFGLAMQNASKLGGFKLAPGKGPVVKQTSGPVTLTDHERSYEFVSGEGWHEIVAIDLASGQAQWRQDLGGEPVQAAGIADGLIWIQQPGGRRTFRLSDGLVAARSSNPS